MWSEATGTTAVTSVNNSKISLCGKKAVAFFQRSGLSTNVLNKIWVISSRTNASHLSKDEFYLAVRLIAYAHNNIAVEEASLRANLEVALPSFDLQSKRSSAPIQCPLAEPELRAEEVAKALPNLD